MAKTDEIVSLSGVSRSTVFRFMRGDNVRLEAKERILSAMQQLNLPFNNPKSGAEGSFIISIRPDFQYFKGYGLSIMGFMSRADQYGYKVQLQTEHLSSLEKINKSKREFKGVLILGKTIEEEEADVHLLKDAGIPYVLVNRTFTENDVSWVSVDMIQAAKDAVQHLINLGYRNIGTWGASSHYRIDRDKRSGYELAFSESGLKIPECRFDDEHDGSIEQVIQMLIDQKRLPEAWFAASDEIAMRVSKVLRENGLSVPGDIALVGMDDVEPAAYLNPPLTSVHIPYQAAGTAAMDVLKFQADNPGTISQRIILQHRLVVRESCGSKNNE